MAVWIAAAVAALIVAVFLFVPVRLDFRYKKDAVQNTAELYLKYMWFRIKIIPREQKPPKKQAQKKQEPEQKKDFSIEVFKQQFAHYKKIFEHSKDDIAAIFQYAGEKASGPAGKACGHPARFSQQLLSDVVSMHSAAEKCAYYGYIV